MSARVLMEVHTHTKEVSPCGWLSASEVIDALHAAGYGAVVITDHFIPGERSSVEKREHFLSGYRAAKEAGEKYGITVLPGMEIRFATRPEDYLVYGMEEGDILGLPEDVCEKGPYEFHKLAQESGWLVYQAHPFRSKILPAHPRDIDGMETFNGNPRHNSQNRLAAAFAARHSLHTLAGSDIHQTGDTSVVGILVPKDALTPREFAKWLQKTPHPRVQYQEAPIDGIRYVVGAIPGREMLSALYRDAGWATDVNDISRTMAGLGGSLRVVTAWDDTTLVGMARLIGDGHTILYVQDILVLGAYQRRQIGTRLLRKLLAPYPNARQVALTSDDSPMTRGFFAAQGFEDIERIHCRGYIMLR